MKELFNSEFVSIFYDPETNTLKEQWKLHFGIRVEGDVFRQPMELILKNLKEQKGIEKYLSNITERKALAYADQVWMEEVFYPSLSNIGLQKLAIVNAKDIQEISIVKNMLKNLNEKISIEIFNKSKVAETWLATN